MKRKEAAFKSMLKQATPPLEPEASWETVGPESWISRAVWGLNVDQPGLPGETIVTHAK